MLLDQVKMKESHLGINVEPSLFILRSLYSKQAEYLGVKKKTLWWLSLIPCKLDLTEDLDVGFIFFTSRG